MEIHSATKNIDALFDLNNKFVKYYPYCEMTSHDYVTKGVKKFLGMLSKDGITLLAAEYIMLGTYTREKNVWVWADMSVTMDKSMSKEIKSLRSKLLETIKNDTNETDEIKGVKSFIENNYTVLPTQKVVSILGNIMKVLTDITKSIILTNGFRDIVDVLLIKRVIHDGTGTGSN
jgi:hypothetical protein